MQLWAGVILTRAEEAESSHILQILQRTKGVIGGRNGAAARLGLPRTTLIAKMKRPGIKLGQSSVLPVRAIASVPNSEEAISGSQRRVEFLGRLPIQETPRRILTWEGCAR